MGGEEVPRMSDLGLVPGRVPGAGEALQPAEEEGEEGEQHRIQGAAERTHLSRLRMERSAEAGELPGEGGRRMCHVG